MKNNNIQTKIDFWLNKMPVIAILRGVKPDEVVNIGNAIFTAGIGIIEIPLNSPKPFASINKLVNELDSKCVIGCGTLVNNSDVKKLAKAGGQIAVTPNSNAKIIKKCIKHGIVPAPGWATPSEAFTAYQAGARVLKLFPASTYGVSHIAAVKAVLPDDARILAVGGVGSTNAAEWLSGGIDGFGIASEIYKPGYSAQQVGERVSRIVTAIRQAQDAL